MIASVKNKNFYIKNTAGMESGYEEKGFIRSCIGDCFIRTDYIVLGIVT